MSAPLTIAIRAKTGRTVVGEPALIEVEQKTTADLTLETVELNRARTRLTLTPVDPPGPAEVLTGADHARLYGVADIEQLGRTFKAPAGSAWKGLLELGQWRRPLAPGRWRLELSYRWGDGPDALQAGPVDLEVAAAPTLEVAPRWFARRNPRGSLAAVRTVRDGEATRLLYQVSPARDPGLVSVGVDVTGDDLVTAVGDAAPRLAHLNAIEDMRYERWMAWVGPEAVGWLQCQKRGRAGGPGRKAHALDATPPPRLVDPPLHTADGRLVVAAIGNAGGKPALTLIEVTPNGEAAARQVGLLGPAERAVMVWTAESPPAGWLYRTEPSDDGGARLLREPVPGGRPRDLSELGWTADQVVALVADQWCARGGVALLSAGAVKDQRQPLRCAAWTIGKDDLAAERARSVDAPFDFVEAQPVPGGLDVVTLGRVAAGWRVVAPHGAATVPLLPGGEPRPPRLVVGWAEDDDDPPPVWLVRWTPQGVQAVSPTWEAR